MSIQNRQTILNKTSKINQSQSFLNKIVELDNEAIATQNQPEPTLAGANQTKQITQSSIFSLQKQDKFHVNVKQGQGIL